MLELYKRIKLKRKEKNLSQEELAKLTGYKDRTSISKIEKGQVDLSHSKIVEFANALNTTPTYLMGWEDEPEAKIPTIKDKFPTTPHEKNIIGKYRLLDDFGQEQVERTIDNELDRVESLEIHTIAAHADDMENIDEETIKQLKRIVMEHKRKKQQEDKE